MYFGETESIFVTSAASKTWKFLEIVKNGQILAAILDFEGLFVLEFWFLYQESIVLV